MVGKLSLFLRSSLFPFSHIFPHRRQQLMELLKELAEDAPSSLYCEDILELWAEDFGVGGMLLGNAALFLLGLILMIGVDVLIHRCNSLHVSLLAGSLTTLYCLVKFRTAKLSSYFFIILFCLYWLISGFWWSIGFLFLVYFTNTCVRYDRGGKRC